MSAPAPSLDLDLIAKLRDDLAAAGYTVAGAADALGEVAAAALLREQPLPARHALAGNSGPCSTLIRLFGLGDAVDAAEAALALPTLGIDGAASLGLVGMEGGAVRALVDVRPYASDSRDWWVVSDLTSVATGAPLPTDHVLGIGGASTTLASWTPRPAVSRALDLGTGSGVQALHLGAHAEHITVTDLSERALAFARFTAALNGANWDVRAGSLFEPVAGDLFDLVVSNPPFVITPRSAEVPMFEYRDGGATGDEVVATLVRGVGAVLAPGGIAQFLGNWEIPQGGEWTDRVGAWFSGGDLDAWVVQREVQDPAQYAETWARDGGHEPGTADGDAMYAAWLDDFASRGVGGIGFGIITLRRPTDERAGVIDLMDVRHEVASPMGPAILAGLLSRDWLADRTDDELLDVAWVAADDLTREQYGLALEADPSVILIRQGGGLRRSITLSTLTAAFVSVCDGELSARAAAAAIAGILDLDGDEARDEILAFIKDAAKDGLIHP